MIPAFGLPTASESGQLIRLVRRFAASPRLCRALATYARADSIAPVPRGRGWRATPTRWLLHALVAPEAWARTAARPQLAIADGAMVLRAEPRPTVEPCVYTSDALVAIVTREDGRPRVRLDTTCLAIVYRPTILPRTRMYWHELPADRYVIGQDRAALLERATLLARLPDLGTSPDIVRSAAYHCMDEFVTLDDALAVGACMAGIRLWCRMVGLDGRQAVPMMEAVGAYARYPSPYAHDAIRYAMARAKAARTAPANQEPQP